MQRKFNDLALSGELAGRKARIAGGLFAALVATAALANAATPPAAEPKGSDLFKPVPRPEPGDPKSLPRTKEGKPDFTGVWLAGVGAGELRPGPTKVPLNPTYMARYQKWMAANAEGRPFADSVSRCEAFGMPRVMSIGYIEFIQQPKQLTIITEVLHEARRVYMDGRPHPTEFDPSFDGHSIGHWEGDTLVIDTVGLKENNIDGLAWHSDKAHIVERITMPNPNGIIDEITLTDPGALTAPYKTERFFKREPSSMEIEEYICTNQRNPPDAEGRQTAE
jgi:hypothetical protein